MSFVFVSHANADKAKIKPIVDALIKAGMKVWLDKPQHMGYSKKEIDAQFYRLRAGEDWEKNIHLGLQQAAAVVVCWSQHALEANRGVWHSEAAIAAYQGKIAPCRIDDIDLNLLPLYQRNHAEDLRSDQAATYATNLACFIDDVRDIIKRQTETQARDRTEQPNSIDPFIPYLVNRDEQENPVIRALQTVRDKPGVKPIMIMGPENECLNEFLERLENYTIPKHAGKTRWEVFRPNWPGTTPVSKFKETFQESVGEKIDAFDIGTIDSIREKLASFKAPVALFTCFGMTGWCPQNVNRIRAWSSFWVELAKSGTHELRAVPVLCIQMPAADPGWQDCPDIVIPETRLKCRDVFREIKRLSVQKPGFFPWLSARNAPSATQEPVRITPILHPILPNHGWDWLIEHKPKLGAPLSKRADAALKEMFAANERKMGVSMKLFAAEMAGVLTQANGLTAAQS